MTDKNRVTGKPAVGGYIHERELEIIEELPQSPLVFDVGANVGDFTQAVLERRPSALVYAFEPQTVSLMRLRERFGSSSNVVICPVALGEDNYNGTLYFDAPASQLATLYPRERLPEIKMDERERVPVRTVTNWVNQGMPGRVTRVSLLKIDAEGSELSVIRGAQPALGCIDTILWEHIEGETRYTDATAEDFVEALDGFDVEGLKSPENRDELSIYVARRRKKEAPA